MPTETTRERLRRVLIDALPPTQTEKYKEDRLKAIASVAQTLALSVSGLGVITPFFTASGFNWKTALFALLAGTALESASLLLLAYIPYPAPQEDQPHG